MDWDQKKSLQLLDEYEKARLLWDSKHPQYYTKSKKQETWEQIAHKLKIEMPELKKKMNSLLGSFRRERSKTRRSLIQGKGTNDCNLSCVLNRNIFLSIRSVVFLTFAGLQNRI